MQESYRFRKLLVETLQEIQEKFPTHQLEYNGIHYWPILKVRLFFDAYQLQQPKKETEQVKLPPKKSIVSRIVYFLQTFFQYTYLIYSPKKRNDYLTAGAWAHRILYKKTWINRYFVNLAKSRIHFEYSSINHPNIDYAKKSYEAERILSMFERFNPIKTPDLIKTDVHHQIIDTFNQRMQMNIQYHFADKYLDLTFKWSKFWEKMLKGVKPREVRLLCYYGANMYGLCLAANRLKIPVIDLQHGGQGNMHSAYNFIGSLPYGGYDVMPSHFSVWDEKSKKDLERSKIVNKENILLEGNPWINYYQQNYKELSGTKQIDILYTLQTGQSTGLAIPEFVYEAILSTHEKYKWVLKTHPRTPKCEAEKIKQKLIQLGLTNSVKISNDDVLLELILSSKIHVSAFSGSIVEARLFSVPNIIISAIGANIFEEQLSEDKNYFKFADTKELFIEHLDNILKK